MTNRTGGEYEVLSPWAEADPIPFRGLSPRIAGLAGKKIGLFRNDKRAAEPILNVLQSKLKERFPDVEFTRFVNPRRNEAVIEQDELTKVKFDDWLQGVDAVIADYGD